jgi:hypothetical protein
MGEGTVGGFGTDESSEIGVTKETIRGEREIARGETGIEEIEIIFKFEI